MLAKVISCAIVGLEGAIVEVETDIAPGLPVFTIVGLPNTAVQEARERVRSAIRNSGCVFPMKRVVVNLASAEVREFCHVEDSAQSLLKAAMKQFYLSARAFHRILKLARTIADIEGADIIKAHHLAETIQYRPRSQI
jgi:predicted ATPase with chaperone activity